jgi:purine-cytosine permease-like protein
MNASTVAVFNILACIGWSCVNTIVGAQLIHAVNHSVPGYGGILIIAAATFLVTLFGYKVVHVYEFWSWIPSFIVFLIILGEFAHSGVRTCILHPPRAITDPSVS